MPPKRAPKAPPAPARSPAKKAPRPAATKKKQAPAKPAAKKMMSKPAQPKIRKPMITRKLANLLEDPSASARSIVDFVVGPACGLESQHYWHNGFVYFDNMTPFLLAVAANRLDVVQLLVAEHSVETKAVAERNYTALHMADYKGSLEMMRWLVEQCGLDVEAVDDSGGSPLHLSIVFRRYDVTLLLLELGADPNHSDNYYKCTPLHSACQKGLADVARVLIDNGASQDAVDSRGKTPLDLAVELQHSEVEALLLTRP